MRISVARMERLSALTSIRTSREDAADDQAVRPLQAVVDERVGEDQAEDRPYRRASPRVALAPQRERHRDRGREDQHEHAGGVGAALRLDVGLGRRA